MRTPFTPMDGFSMELPVAAGVRSTGWSEAPQPVLVEVLGAGEGSLHDESLILGKLGIDRGTVHGGRSPDGSGLLRTAGS